MPDLRVEGLAPGEVRVVPYPAGTPPRRSIIVVDTPFGVRAYWNVCKHLPIPLDAGAGQIPRDEAGRLVCATHGAAFVEGTGACTEGPCEGEHLDALEIEPDGDAWTLRIP